MKDIMRLLEYVILLAVGQQQLMAQAPLVHARHLSYDIVYDYARMAPAMVFWTLQSSDFTGTMTAKPKYFKQDRFLPKPRLKNEVFTFIGYQRGHLCPSGDRDSRKEWFKDTFVTSNIVPMTAETNAGAWKETETLCRWLAVQGHQLKIVAGPVWDQTRPDSIPQSFPLVPPTLYKIATCVAHDDVLLCWLIPNSATRHREIDCRHDLESVTTAIPFQISNLIRAWIRK